MKHVFIINPAAGKKDNSEYIIEEVKKHFQENEYLIYITKGVNDAKTFTKEYLMHNKQDVCFYSCGGDGTLNEVVNGAVGFDNAYITSYPNGSGNDYIKVFGSKEDFTNLENLKNGKVVVSDVIKIGDTYSINICNLGFDAKVVRYMNKFRRLPFINGKGAYNLGILATILSKIGYQFTIKVDGKKMYHGKGLLCAIANGTTYGGSYRCAPYAKINDGILDIILIRKISRISFARLIKYYKNGTHLNNPKLNEIVLYTKAKSIEIESKKKFQYTHDGELKESKKLIATIVPNAIKFIIPSNLNY